MKTKLMALTMVAGFATATPAMAWDNGTAGTLLGGAGGAAIGSQFGKGNGQLVGVAIGTLLGAGIGNSVGTSMDRADAVYYNQAQPVRYTQVYQEEYRHVPPGHNKHWKKHKKWRNPDRHNHYVQRDVYVEQYASTDYCREYTSNVIVGGQRQSSYGTACYMPDGSWQIQNSR